MRRGFGFHDRHSPFRFNPATLFVGGAVQGAWYDPSDFSTLFQDSAGTTPVTAVEQPVGLVLDKSKGLVLGSEAVVSPLAGSLGASYSIVGNTIVRNGSTGTAVLNAVGGVVPATSKIYLVTFTASGVTGDSIAIRVGGGTAYGPFAGNGTFTLRVAGGGISGSITFLPYAGGAGTATYSNISVRELPGNHAYQTTSTSRPTLRARYNLLTFSEQFDNGAWTRTGATITANSVTAPDGTLTADTFTSASADPNIRQAATGSASTSYTGTVWLRVPSGTLSTRIQLYDNTGATLGAVLSVTVTTDWQQFSITRTTGASSTQVGIAVGGFGTLPNATLFYIWGAQLVPTAVFPSNTYQRIADAATYATGAAFPPYLSFDGSDDSLLTSSVDFTGTNKMTVFAGAAKLSDAAQAVVAELSATIASNNGTFLLSAPNSAAANYNFSSKGTTQVDNTVTTYTAPNIAVLTGQADIAAPSNIIRVNGAQAGSVATTQGTGNYGNYPLYIGRRNNATLPLNGRIYGLIVLGAAASDWQVNVTEQWMASKTGLQF